jgi:hypothetical protein
MKIIKINTTDYLADSKTKEERQAVCNGCDKFKAGFCTECYCIVATKTAVKDAKCPLEKW